ncbi:Inner membrane protein YghB [Fundidesulfovibrio magnetotacticus]|uniref:Inner membrane protein YghB n=1 Tax=Fundidesulfovibrio magnetotacticus TaxID=2730080 RepID=A0A6V8LUS7_9BACT|nr:VTT domain-containing protein [Fundidesulfovibrio magnetotacticus]GFK94068.1 Inner membrane protein YghB [Fundidesulfovibrio magnetotacticus]
MTIADVWDICLHLENHLLALNQAYGAWVYAVFFAVVFAETGFVVTTALPSDTVLFAVGAMAARGVGLDLWWTLALGLSGAFLGDCLDFAIGRWLGGHVLAGGRIPFISPASLAKAHDYFERHGGATLVAARFVPVLRSVAPLVGGMVRMEWRPFLFYNAVGKLLWTPLYLFGGYFFGQIPWVRQNFGVAIFFALGAPLLGVVARMVYLSVTKGR